MKRKNKKTTTSLKETLITYPEELLTKWVKGDYSMLTSSKASKFIKEFSNISALI